MAKIKPAIREKELRSDGTVNVKLRVTHNRKVRYVATDYYVLPKSFDDKTGRILPGGEYDKDKAEEANNKIQIKKGIMLQKVERQKNVRFMDISSLMAILRDKRAEYDLYAMLDARVRKFEKAGNMNYRDLMKKTKTRVEEFTGHSLVPFESIDPAWLMRFEDWMITRGLRSNTVGIYMRDIRTAFNQAITMGLVDYSYYPFRKYKIPKEATRKRNLTAEELSVLAKKEIKAPLMAWARDMYMLSFYLIGINMRDLFYLQGIEDGRLYYIRSKGKKPYNIKVWPEAHEIIDRYPGKKYLLDTLDNYSDYRYATKRINKKLKDIAGLCKIDKEITTYYARHSWATIASSIGVPKDVIAYALGHAFGSDMTSIYVDYDLIKVDHANRQVIDRILKTFPSAQHPLPDTDVVFLLDQ